MDDRDPLTEAVIGAAMEVHRVLGPGLMESVYERCLSLELTARGIKHFTQMELPVVYKGVTLDCQFRMDVVLPEKLVIELKTVEKILPIHNAQLLTYLKLSRIHLGLILNFNTFLLKDGIKR